MVSSEPHLIVELREDFVSSSRLLGQESQWQSTSTSGSASAYELLRLRGVGLERCIFARLVGSPPTLARDDVGAVPA